MYLATLVNLVALREAGLDGVKNGRCLSNGKRKCRMYIDLEDTGMGIWRLDIVEHNRGLVIGVY
jgi:hypothetical protein